jgi:enoyl-CoA hydratase/carnithine racemase
LEYDNFIVEDKGNIRIVSIHRPPANAWNLAAVEEFEQIIDKLETEKEIRVVVITGAGEKNFSAGFDIKDADNAPKTSAKGRSLWTRIDQFPKPLIAAINGPDRTKPRYHPGLGGDPAIASPGGPGKGPGHDPFQ